MDSKIDLNKKMDNGVTFLMREAWAGNPEMVQFLIENGANIHEQDAYGFTALHFAAFSRKDEKGADCIELLTQAGANINAVCYRGNTPLMYATRAGNVECVKMLRLLNADFSIANKNGMTPLKTILWHIDETLDNGMPCDKWAEFLLSQGADINETNTNGDNLLLQLLFECDDMPKTADFLLNNKMDINRQNHEGLTPLMVSIINNNQNCFSKIMQKNVDLNLQNNRGVTALMYAAMLKRQDMIYALIDKKADVKLQTQGGETFWGYMSESMRRRFVEDYKLTRMAKYIKSHDLSNATMERIIQENHQVLQYKI